MKRLRIVLAALVISALVHAALIVALPGQVRPPVELDDVVYSATLDPAAPVTAGTAAPATPAPARPSPRRARPKPSPPRPEEAIASMPGLVEDTPPAPKPIEEGNAELLAGDDAPPEKLALAEPATPVRALEPPRFPAEALPAKLSISYALNSQFADGRAEYSWKRDGDRYEISGSMQATGFFAVFLEGQITQESRGLVSAEGLKPERFIERRPRAPDEGLTFDWVKGTMTFNRNDETREGKLSGNTVDWLSMIFQLAHSPPKGERVALRVFTQRKLYTFSLVNVGEEMIDIPLGRVRALHLRHEGRTPVESVDVWLGVDQHYLPVKMRYPVARNRFQVEQVATGISK